LRSRLLAAPEKNDLKERSWETNTDRGVGLQVVIMVEDFSSITLSQKKNPERNIDDVR
jgi:hypothetical protein